MGLLLIFPLEIIDSNTCDPAKKYIPQHNIYIDYSDHQIVRLCLEDTERQEEEHQYIF
ncbi:MAG TPA: hypothetical protein VMW10_12315 [Alphaproteobacteria bacterium]|nr:hypothetical protein [Alphaproteobacteria bacterium]